MWWTFKKEENSSKSHIDENWSSKNYVCEIRSTRKYFEKLVMVRRTQELCADTRFKRDLKGRSRGFQLVSNESKIHRLATIIHRNLLHKRNSQKICTYIICFSFEQKHFTKYIFFFICHRPWHWMDKSLNLNECNRDIYDKFASLWRLVKNGWFYILVSYFLKMSRMLLELQHDRWHSLAFPVFDYNMWIIYIFFSSLCFYSVSTLPVALPV